jgi:hypothetical protein
MRFPRRIAASEEGLYGNVLPRNGSTFRLLISVAPMARSLVDHFHSIDVRRLVGARWLWGTWRWLVGDRETGSVSYELRPADSLVLVWASGGMDHRLSVTLASTAPNFGGQRWWALCPTCGRRCAILYGHGRGFACRLCRRLAYKSTREDELARACRRLDKVRDRYGAPRGIANPWPGKPTRMRWTTFAKLLEREREALRQVSTGWQG